MEQLASASLGGVSGAILGSVSTLILAALRIDANATFSNFTRLLPLRAAELEGADSMWAVWGDGREFYARTTFICWSRTRIALVVTANSSASRRTTGPPLAELVLAVPFLLPAARVRSANIGGHPADYVLASKLVPHSAGHLRFPGPRGPAADSWTFAVRQRRRPYESRDNDHAQPPFMPSFVAMTRAVMRARRSVRREIRASSACSSIHVAGIGRPSWSIVLSQAMAWSCLGDGRLNGISGVGGDLHLCRWAR